MLYLGQKRGAGMSVCYLLHFDRPISPDHTCRHYLGFANHLETRLEHHRKGTSGVRLLQVAHERGITFVVARVWEGGTKELEKKLKKEKNAPRLCLLCNDAK